MGTETSSQDQRQQILEALERRFVVAKAELLQQQKKCQKHKSNEEHMSAITAYTHPSSSISSRRDVEDIGPEYASLSHTVHKNLMTTNFETKKGSTADMLIHDLLQHGDSAQKYMQGSRSKKLDNWILLDNYVQGHNKSATSFIRSLEAHSKRSKRHMSMKQHKKCGSFDLPQDLRKFDSFKPMHEMWKAYMSQLIRSTGTNQLGQILLGADLHGAIIIVVECKIASFIGVGGIMIRETAETFGIITQDDKFRVVPKGSSVFMFQLECWKITLQGDKLRSRNLDL